MLEDHRNKVLQRKAENSMDNPKCGTQMAGQNIHYSMTFLT